MKNISKLFAVGTLTLFLLATITPVFGVNIQTMNNNIVFEFSFSEPQIEETTIGNQLYDRITVDGLSNTCNFNEPCLPMKSVKILLPYGRTLNNLVVATSGKISLGYDHVVELGRHLMPVADRYDVSKYSSEKENEGIFPGQLFSIVGTHTFRGYPVLFVNLHPVHYDLKTGEIFYYEHMNLVVETRESSPVSSFRGLLQDLDVITDIVDNPSYVNTYLTSVASTTDDTYEYVIITGEDFSSSNNRDYSFEDLIQSKIDKGLTAGIFTVEEIVNDPEYGVNGAWGDNNPSNPFYESPIIGDIGQFDDDQARIRNFIRYAYTELGTKYVLLGGDADFGDVTQNIVPVRCIYANETGLPLVEEWFEEDDIPSDVYYACLDGNFNYDGDERWGEDEIGNDEADIDEADLLAEVWVGRACIDSDIEVSNFVKKTLVYEATDDPYLKDILLVGEYLGFPGVSE